MAQTYALARQAGFDPAQAVIMAAIAAGESGLDPWEVGDEDLQDATWGPSVGLPQIRTLKRDTGTGRTRDIVRLRDPLQQMIAAYEISNRGRDFSPWEVYTKGIYREYLGQASTAAGTSPVAYLPGAGAVQVQQVGWQDEALAVGQRWMVVGLVGLGGLVLVVLGAVRATGTGSLFAGLVPAGRAVKGASMAAKAAAR